MSLNETESPGRILVLNVRQRLALRDALAVAQIVRKLGHYDREAHLAWRRESGVDPGHDDTPAEAMEAFAGNLDDQLALGPSTQARREAVARECEASDLVQIFGVPRDADPYARAAWDSREEGLLEVDDPTIVSRSDGGAYVLAWLFVSDRDAGVEPPSALLEDLSRTLAQVLETPVARVAAGSTAWDTERVLRLQAYNLWLEETISNFGEEIDEVCSPGGAHGEIHFAHQGRTWAITPSVALGEMLNACGTSLDTTGRGDRIRDAVGRLGPLLDTNLAGFALQLEGQA